MKKLFLLVAVSLLVASCSKEKEQNTTTRFAKVNVHFNDFSITQEDFPSKNEEDPASYSGVKAMTLAFYNVAGVETYKETQIQSDPSTYTTFGSFSADLPIGNYTMVALGYDYYDGDEFFLTSPTSASFTSERPRETFCTTQSVTVTGSVPLNLEVTLSRITSLLRVISTDGRPAEAVKVRTTYAKGGKSFNPTTGLATVDNGFSQTNTPSAAAGATVTFNSSLFLFTDEENITVTIEALDANDNVLITKTIPNVPFKRNRRTTLTGTVYTPGSSTASFNLETSWLTDETLNF